MRYVNGTRLTLSMNFISMFYADDAIFMGQWSKRNIDTLMYMLKCFERASGLSINLSKSKLMGLAVSIEKVEEVTRHIGCGILNTPFSFLGSKVGGYARSGIESNSGDHLLDSLEGVIVKSHRDRIRHKFIVLDTPTRELLKEKNRALENMVNVMFLSPGLCHEIWEKAIISATYLLDKIPYKENDEVIQDQRQRDDNDLQDERQDQPKEELVEPRRSKRARTEKRLDPILFLL
ncbi:hypothetical protein Tco_0221374 [Tanacetum coccineum]